MAEHKTSFNWLLHGFILLSLGIHGIVFLHVAGIYENRTISYIELSLHQTDKPHLRVIPKPRLRRTAPVLSKVKTVQVKSFSVPKINISPVPDRQIQIASDDIRLPQLPADMDISRFCVAGLAIQDPVQAVEPHEAEIEFTSARDYFEMLNLRIHRFKRYPDDAKLRHIEGRVKVEFVLLANGSLANIKIFKSSHHKNLDQAAIEAVKQASPFPKPPVFLFKTPITMRISILFELA